MTHKTATTSKPLTHFDVVYKDSFRNLVNYITDFAASQFMRQQIALKLQDYSDTEGRQALIDLWAWLLYAHHHNVGYAYADVAHDLNNYNATFFTPRTQGYAVQIWGEGFINYTDVQTIKSK